MLNDNSVPPKSIEDVFKHLESGKSVYVATYTKCTVINNKTLNKFRKVDAWLLKEDGDGYRMQTGKSSVYLIPGQLKYGGWKMSKCKAILISVGMFAMFYLYTVIFFLM